MRAHRRGDVDTRCAFVHVESDVNLGQWQGVTQGNQGGGLFCGQHPRYLRRREHIAFGKPFLDDEAQRLRTHLHHATRHGNALGVRFIAYVHHTDVTFGIQMT